jgi:hypothetical protein
LIRRCVAAALPASSIQLVGRPGARSSFWASSDIFVAGTDLGAACERLSEL